eukprot:14396-Eustigmatos_ZCMA.PRE.1
MLLSVLGKLRLGEAWQQSAWARRFTMYHEHAHCAEAKLSISMCRCTKAGGLGASTCREEGCFEL